MSRSLTATFATRRDAEMTVERLVQEFGIERTDIFVAAEGDANTAGTAAAGSDAAGAEAGSEERADGAHDGGVTVSVDINDEGLTDRVGAAFAEFEAAEVER
ncbi:hypothetical protein [Sphingomonas montanisoli]|uniref:Uncharacterized protein n=1 Tax=Sphingomonas montanisoli TaxID=2606412 RepID=A0A5D9C1K0_9SPHN|nr:hypothetical protein [Sphingomonas montanisoli]TZG25738.1 hypothetical protein FYJ91_12090 [Sphingomonas montanisoli]